MFNLVVVLVALGLLMYLAFRGFSLLILAPATALLTGGLPILAAYTAIFMSNTGPSSSNFSRCFCSGRSSAS